MCECGEPPCEEGRWPELCADCQDYAYQDAADQAAIDRAEDRLLFPEDYDEEWFMEEEVYDL